MNHDVETFRRTRTGDDVRPMDARTYNAVVDAARDVSAAGLGPKEGPPALPDKQATSVEIWVRNDTGATLEQFGIAAVNMSAPVVLPSVSLPTFAETDAHAAIALSPGTNPEPTIVITKEPIGPGAFGLATISGYTKVRVTVTAEGDPFAFPGTDPTRLTTGASGPAKILWLEPAGSGSGSGSGDGGRWAVVLLNGAGGVGTIAWANILAVVGTFPQSGSGSGCGSGAGGCPAVYHAAVLQTYDPVCDQWTNGGCATVVDVEGRTLEVGRRYMVSRIGTSSLLVVPSNDSWPCGLSGRDPLYMADAGDINRVVEVRSRVGPLCGSGSGSALSLIVYRGAAVRWDPAVCKWFEIEGDVLLAHVAGCELTIGNRYMSHWHKMVAAAEIGGSGSGSGTCTSLYLTQVRVGRYVTDVLCVGGVEKVYKSSDECGASAFANDAGCCDCGDGGSGSGSAGSCPCDGVPTAAHFTAATFNLTNGSCTGCNGFPTSFTLTHTTGCQWDSATLVNPCGGSSGATLVYTSSSDTFDLFISGGAAGFGAHYRVARGSFNCNGSNTLTLVSSGGGCTGWPATVTLTPF